MNTERLKRGLESYRYSDALRSLALRHSTNMMKHEFFSHTDHRGMDSADRKNTYFPHLFGVVGENIAYIQTSRWLDIPKQVMRRWMNSPGHRRNILSSAYSHIGVGFVR
ncbi:hypothetical protein GWN42_19490, partial [candidate division KSB1 bacterium]|nr:CAP domain-containing protein [candidate division KSB1 bacterium]NIS26180.1 CAP domain-containing protein [candidate division KSB1 bacterium]NIU26827.1 CAP domain-containing protein [candidate division KSB1 bacterium]NIU92343.1 hypothetical protein [candidate division KSB1 bacterium]NIV94909.1 hypothetical protein [candidate division KSB1 bacterium]